MIQSITQMEDLKGRLNKAQLNRTDYPLPKGSLALEDDGRQIDAAVLVPVRLNEVGKSIILTQRAAHLKAHAGQISFPGGRIEKTDESPFDAALRETEEEIGLSPHSVSLVASLPKYITGTGYRVYPFVGVVQGPISFRLQEEEVAEVFEVPLDYILDERNQKEDFYCRKGVKRRFFAFEFHDRYIWGATAAILVMFAQLLRDGSSSTRLTVRSC